MATLDDIRISDLRLFLLVADEGSLREVSRKERIEPSRLSKTIRKIERIAGGALFLRSSQGLSLTPLGERFAETARNALAPLRTLSANKPRTGDEKKIISVAAPTFLTSSLITRITPAIAAEFPDTRLRLINVSQDQMVSSAIQGVFEVAAHVGDLDWPKSWSTVPLGKQRSSLYARIGHPLKSPADLAQIRGQSFIVPIQWTKNRVYYGTDHCPLPLSERKLGAEVSTADIAISLLCASDHVAFLPDLTAQRAVAEKRIRKIVVQEWSQARPDREYHEVSGSLFLSVRSDRISQRVHRAFVRELKASIV